MTKRKNINSRKQGRKPVSRKPSPRQILETGIAPQTFKPVILEPVTYKAPTLTPENWSTPGARERAIEIESAPKTEIEPIEYATQTAIGLANPATKPRFWDDKLLRISGALAVVLLTIGGGLWFVG